MPASWTQVGAIALLVACTTDRDPDDRGPGLSASGLGSGATEGDGHEGAGDGIDDGDGGSGNSGGSGATGGEGGGDDDIRFDVGEGNATQGTADGGTREGCGKIDFLFVVDSSGSMGGKQDNLVRSFPGFISTIQDVLDIDDYHIMVVDTDATAGDMQCDLLCGIGFGCSVPCDQVPTGCAAKLGGGKRTNRNLTECSIQGNQRYIVKGQPNLSETFECIARVGTNGDGDERPMGAMVNAISAAEQGPGGCNEGFLRKDAILVVTVITDEEDDPNDPQGDGCRAIDADSNSQGNPNTWRDALLAAKHNDEQAIVFLGLVGDCDVAGGTCQPLVQTGSSWSGAEPSPRLRQLAESFTFGSWGSVCAPDYTDFFQEAVSVIDTACEVFNPPG